MHEKQNTKSIIYPQLINFSLHFFRSFQFKINLILINVNNGHGH